MATKKMKRKRPTQRKASQPKAALSRHSSRYDLFRGILDPFDDPYWLRLAIWISMLVFYLGLVLLLAKYAQLGWGVGSLAVLPRLKNWLTGKGRSP